MKQKPRQFKLKGKSRVSQTEILKILPNETFEPRPHIPYEEKTAEQIEKLKVSTAKSITKRLQTSPRFRKYQMRVSNESTYRRVKGLTKICSICERDLGIVYFDLLHSKSHSKRYRRPYCIDCRKKMNQEAYQRRKELA